MTARRGGGPPANAALRGGLIILVAIAVGALLLSRGFSGDDGFVEAADDTPDGTEEPSETTVDTTDDTEPTDTTEDTTDDTTGDTEPTVEVRPNEEIRYVVLNGSGAAGAAGAVSNELSALNYLPSDPDNVPGGNVEDSLVYYAEGWQAEAAKVAADLGHGTEITVPLPTPFEYDPGDATIVVVLGTDGVIAAG